MGKPATKLTTLLRYTMFILVASISLAACGGAGATPGGTTATTQSITFWAAPNPPQQAFWTAMAKAYMAQHTGTQITVRAMPESPSSEAGIQAAIAGGTAPTARSEERRVGKEW